MLYDLAQAILVLVAFALTSLNARLGVGLRQR